MGMFVGLIFFCICGSIMNHIWHVINLPAHWYMFLTHKSFIKDFLIRLGNWIIIFGNVVPISLLVSLEGVKFIQAVIISRDKGLATDGIYCEVQSSNLNEELGNIQYVFSDKTGTLTRNEMIFRKLLIGSTPYGDPYTSSESQTSFDDAVSSDTVWLKGRKLNFIRLQCLG